MSLKPRTKVPALSLPTVDGGHFDLAASKPSSFSMLVFYRGLHCPICKGYLRDLDRKLDDFAQRGVEAVAISTDTQARAQQAKTEWGIERLPIAYGLSVDDARRWGLYISTSMGQKEPPLFSEPGLFLIQPDGVLYCSSVQTMPFARPSFAELLQAVAFVTEKHYPARGEA
ncbi:MAG: AhpC/TSA family protein [Gammaproteobacteria bacterium]|nr:AhpC/TSA family protein [Gammaproteobacteria bacterium]